MGVETLPPRDLAKALMRCSSARSWIADPHIPLGEVVKAERRGGAGMSGPSGYDVHVWGVHIEVTRAQGKQYSPPVRFTIHEIVAEMRAEARRLTQPRQPTLWEEATA